jgi:hypothetical protein
MPLLAFPRQRLNFAHKSGIGYERWSHENYSRHGERWREQKTSDQWHAKALQIHATVIDKVANKERISNGRSHTWM